MKDFSAVYYNTHSDTLEIYFMDAGIFYNQYVVPSGYRLHVQTVELDGSIKELIEDAEDRAERNALVYLGEL